MGIISDPIMRFTICDGLCSTLIVALRVNNVRLGDKSDGTANFDQIVSARAASAALEAFSDHF